jgi:hypothetical protein
MANQKHISTWLPVTFQHSFNGGSNRRPEISVSLDIVKEHLDGKRFATDAYVKRAVTYPQTHDIHLFYVGTQV